MSEQIQEGREASDKGEQALSLEELFSQLDEILKQMESGEMTLDASFALYEEGLKKLKLCNEKLDRIETRMLILSSAQEAEGFEE